MNFHEDMDIFTVFSIIGTIAFAVSGAIVAMEEEYDILGVYVLGLVSAFGGGVVRNLLIDVPVTMLWTQGMLLKTAVLAMTITFLLPVRWIKHGKKARLSLTRSGYQPLRFKERYMQRANTRFQPVIVAAMLTGIGGGIIRDVLAGRKPLVLRDEIYAVWAMAAGAAIGLKWFVTELICLHCS